MKAAPFATSSSGALETRLLTFKELATLMETASGGAWLKIFRRTLPVGPDDRHISSAQIKTFIELNAKLFGPGKNEL